jgi:hypothetical protein
MSHDQQTVLSAYDDVVKKLYATLFDSYVTAGGDANEQQQAEQRFSNGLTLARQSRDKAVALTA